MADDTSGPGSWLRRIGYAGPCAPTLATLSAVIAAHAATIPYENIDVLLGRPPKLDLAALQQKMIAGGRGGYCFEQNMLLRAGLLALGFTVTSLIARVIRARAPDAPVYALHMVLRVDLPEGPFLADVGYGALTPTAPLAMRPNVEQTTPHETMRLVPAGEELTLQAKLGEDWENIYRLLPQSRLDTDYEIANWFAATHPSSLFVNNLIAARPGPGGVRNTLFNGRLTVRRPPGQVTRRMLEGAAEYGEALADTFGLVLSGAELSAALEALDRKGTLGAVHPFF
jgi:N-hydroxyarylamine O-acetyltransferase